MSRSPVEMTERVFRFRFERFGLPDTRALVAPCPSGLGAIAISLKGNGAVEIQEVTLDGREPRMARLPQAANPGTYRAALGRTRAWILLDGRIHTVCLDTFEWDRPEPLPSGCPDGRVVPVDDEEAVLLPATDQLKARFRVRRTDSGGHVFRDLGEGAAPTHIVSGEPTLWCFGREGRIEQRDGDHVLGHYELPPFTDLLLHQGDLFARSRDSVTLLRRRGDNIKAAKRCVLGFLGADSNGLLVVASQPSAARRRSCPFPDHPDRLELIDPGTLGVRGGVNLGRDWGFRWPMYAGRDTGVSINDKQMKVLTWTTGSLEGVEPRIRGGSLLG